MKKKVIFFGGSGFLGKYFCENIIKNNHDLTIIDIVKPKIKGKYSCPMCRTVLTPPPSSVFDSLQAEETEYPSDTAENRLREAIVASSRRGRDAVRLSMLRNNARQALG